MTARPGRGQVGKQAFSNHSKRGSCRSKEQRTTDNNTVENESRGSQTTTQYEREVPGCPHCVFPSRVILMCYTSGKVPYGCLSGSCLWHATGAEGDESAMAYHSGVFTPQLSTAEFPHRSAQRRSLYTAVPQRSLYTAAATDEEHAQHSGFSAQSQQKRNEPNTVELLYR